MRSFALRWFAAAVLGIAVGSPVPSFAAAPRARAPDCSSCHGDSSLSYEKDGKSVSAFVDDKAFKKSVHGSLACADCHKGVKEYPHPAEARPESCASCHPDADQRFHQGRHARATPGQRSGAVRCADCHGSPHAILPSGNSASLTYRTNIPRTCGECHGVKFVVEPENWLTDPFFSYQKSIHGRSVAAQSQKAAICTDCHQSHEIRSAADPLSPIFKFNIPKTCGQCHAVETAEFTDSVHGRALTRGNSRTPVCTDCHGIHLIKSHIDVSSSVAQQSMAHTACGQCHERVQLSQEFGIASGRVRGYLSSYHGLASQRGSRMVANCASCHGVHRILDSSNPESKINKKNLTHTCGQCHPGASESFSQTQIHGESGRPAGIGVRVNRIVTWFYRALIVLTIGGMLAHNALSFRKKLLAHLAADRTFVRMSLALRIQHHLLFVVFTYLALTGFALKFPDSWLTHLVGSEETRSLGHRIAGVVLILLGLVHAAWAGRTGEGRKLLRDLWPSLRDIGQFFQNLGYYLDRRKEPSRFGRFGYPEKMEYWAGVWGCVIMAATGIIIWAKLAITACFPGWVVDVATSIHWYETILAVSAIVVWHLYHVMFDPDVYPLNPSILDGKVSREWYRHEHPEDPEAGGDKNGPSKPERPVK